MIERDNILRILKETKKAIKVEDVAKLKELSNQTIHSASISQDPDNITVAVIVYSLSKILERKVYQAFSGWNKFYKNINICIDNLIINLPKNNEADIKKNLETLRKSIDNVSGNLKSFIQDVFRKASINKASRIYEHGISMEKTADLLGITMFELASYSGQTNVSDVPLGMTMDTKSRIKLAMNMFK